MTDQDKSQCYPLENELTMSKSKRIIWIMNINTEDI